MVATSGTTSAESESLGNNWNLSHLVDAFSTQWCGASLAARDAKAMKTEAVVAAIDFLTCLDSSRAASRSEHAISWNDVRQPVDDYGDGDEEHYEDDVEWHASSRR